SRRAASLEVMLTDLKSGRSISLVTLPIQSESYWGGVAPRISPDGSRVAFSAVDASKFSGFMVPAAGGITRKICDCFVRHWAADNRRLIASDSLWTTGFLDPDSGQFETIVGPGSAPRTSWDDKWVTFYVATPDGKTRMWIAPVRAGSPAAEKEWIPLNDGSTYEVVPELSPDGSRVYFLSHRDGARCLWVQKLDAAKRPAGKPEPVYHFHSARRSPIYNRFGQNAASVSRNKIALPITERLGNIWMAELPQ
ncbi:MAG: hypothetical protein U0Q18_37665, partial [Bryobacteraceae bacterium]